jgi:hypothetical protein
MKSSDPLLLQLEYPDFNRIVSELIEEDSGTIFYYAIDTYDLLNYCFPFGIRKREIFERGQLDIDIIADEQYTFYQLFNSNKSKVILLDEYVREVLDAKRFIEQSISSGVEIINSLRKYEESFYRSGTIRSTDEIEFEDIIKTKLSLVLSTAIGIIHDGIDKLVDLFKSKKVTITLDESEDAKNDVIVSEAFEKTYDYPANERIFQCVNKIADEIGGTYKDGVSYPTYNTDASVIDRICKVNEILESKFTNNEIPNRIIVLYLSSTVNSSRIFRDIRLDPYFQTIKNSVFNPHRSVAMLFIKLIALESKNVDLSIENLNFLKETIYDLEKYKSVLPKSALLKDVDYILHDKFNYYRENFENYAILSEYYDYRELLNNALSEFNKDQKEYQKLSTLIIPLLEKVIESGEKEIAKSLEKRGAIENWANQVKFVLYFDAAFKKIQNEESSLQLTTGKDPINGLIHHLPIIYYFSEEAYSNIIESITAFVEPNNNNIRKIQILSITKQSFNKAIQLKPSLEERLIKAFIFLLVPEMEMVEDTNRLALNWTTTILESEILTSDCEDFKLIEKDYRYFIAWVSRRCGEYESSIDFLNVTIKLFPDDARFYHGRCLSNYCIYEKNRNELKSNVKEQMLLNCVEDASKAYSLYENQNNRLVIRKTKFTLQNTIAYIFAELSTFSEDERKKNDYIQNADFRIQELRVEEKDFDSYPEYLHTSSFISKILISNNIEELRNNRTNYVLLELIKDRYDTAIADISTAVKITFDRSLERSLEKYKRFQSSLNKDREDFLNEFYY